MDAFAWAEEQLKHLGERALFREPLRSGPVSAVTALQTETARYYLKTCRHTSAYEPGLVAALARWFPDAVPPVVAVDEAQGWLLMGEAGPTVRSLIRADGDRRRSVEMVHHFATLQKGTARYTDALLALGVPDRRLAQLPALYAQLVADIPALLVGFPEGISEEDLARLQAFAPEVEALCQRLASYNLPETLQHDDFHSGNVALADGRYRFLDWGETFIAHPLYSLLIALRDAKYTLEYDEAALHRMRDIYLSCWTDYEPMDRLCEALSLSHRLAALGRALTWWQVMSHADAEERAANADAVPYWLMTFYHNTPLE